MEPPSLSSKPAECNLRLDTSTGSHDKRERLTPSAPQDHVFSIDCLRGIAAFAVCCCHAIKQGPLSSSTHYGWLGIYVFFVVSGFVIPFSLWRGGLTLGGFFTVFAKTMCWLAPPA